MWWLLGYLAYAAAASVAIGAAGYAAVTQLAVLQRLLAAALDRWLKRIAANEDGSAVEYRVWHTRDGERGGAGPSCAHMCVAASGLIME